MNRPQQQAWVPQNEFVTSSTPLSPGYAPPDFSESILKEMWTKLTDDEQNQILFLPEEQQEEAMKKIVINRSQPPFKIPNYGSDGELNDLFKKLSRLEQIELLKMSYSNQINKLVQMAKEESPSNDFNKLRIIIPEKKTSSEELYENPQLKMLAPVENKSSSENKNKKEDNDKNDESSSGGSSSSNIKKITF
jgi:hypothetical protein